MTGYVEKPRRYTNIWFVLLAFAAGFAFDASLGGAVAHLPGWLIAAALVVGIDALFIHSANATRTLELSDDELRVGDEAVPRADIVGATVGGERDTDLPILGWPRGMPRFTHGVTLRLADDRDVIVPTRAPERLAAALGVGDARPRATLEVRPADDADLEQLADIDERSSTLFRLAGYDLPPDEHGPDEFDEARAVFVYDDPPVAFVEVHEVDGLAHVEELAVVPGAMRRGVGTALLERACAWARAERYPAVTLITYRDVPWNAPFYAARGFVETATVTPGLVALRAKEKAAGLDDLGPRIVMRREL